MPTYEVEAIVRVTLDAPNPETASERVEEELENHCSDIKITAVM